MNQTFCFTWPEDLYYMLLFIQIPKFFLKCLVQSQILLEFDKASVTRWPGASQTLILSALGVLMWYLRNQTGEQDPAPFPCFNSSSKSLVYCISCSIMEPHTWFHLVGMKGFCVKVWNILLFQIPLIYTEGIWGLERLSDSSLSGRWPGPAQVF